MQAARGCHCVNRAVTTFLCLLAVVGCAQAPVATPVPTPTRFTGGALRVVIPATGGLQSPFTDGDDAALDPHVGSAQYDAWELLRCCLARTLLSTNGRPAAEGGARLHPDAAEALPEISSDGLTWTFKLKPGLHYSPPLQDVEITAADYIRSFHRLLSPQMVEEFGQGFYQDIVGAAAYQSGEATSISGLESPDPLTLSIRLTAPAGDLSARLATSWIVPIPPNPHNPQARFGVAEGHDFSYGRFMPSSGPYMVEGSPELDFSVSPTAQEPLAGMLPGERISLIPNPSWDPTTDELRGARPERIELLVVSDTETAVAEMRAGRADLVVNNFDGVAVAAVDQDPSLGRLEINEVGATLGVSINTALPPFDDLHVRRAAAHAIDRAAALEAIGGPMQFRPIQHIVPDSMEDNLLLDYHPYGGSEADVTAAKAEMAQSIYDSDGDGICDLDACREVAIASPEGLATQLVQLLADNLSEIGLHLSSEPVNLFEIYSDQSAKVALFAPHGWGRDIQAASNFFVGQFYSPVAEGNNLSKIGASSSQLSEWGYGDAVVPNIDTRIEACIPLTGAAQFECWASLDQYVVESVAPSVPIGLGVIPVLASQRVGEYSTNELTTAPSYDRILVLP